MANENFDEPDRLAARRSHIELLHVDDSEDDLLLVQEFIQGLSFSCRVREARDGEEAMAMLRQEGVHRNEPLPDIILLDIRMPKKSGIEVLKEIKSDPALKWIPVAILTSSNRDKDILQAYDAQACSYITKPLSIVDFSAVLGKFLDYWMRVSMLPGGCR